MSGVTPEREASRSAHQERFRRALSWAVVMTWGQRGLVLAFTVVLAALLGPRDYGVMAMALVYIGFVDLFAEQGIVTAVVQRKELDPRHLDSAFWINLLWCFALAGVSVGLAGWWADVNHTPELAHVIEVLSIAVVLWGLSTIQQGLLERELDFRKLAIRMNVATLLSGVLGIALAIAGYGVWALVGQQLALEAISMLLLWRLGSWRPGFRISMPHAKELFGFSAHVVVADIGGYIFRRGDTLLAGLFFSPVVVGIYRLADRFVETLSELTTRPLSLVSLPHLSRLQDDREELRRSVASLLRLTIVIAVPSMFVLAACSKQVLRVVGSDWVPGTTALRLLAVVGVVKAFVAFTGPLMFALARPGARALVLWAQAAVGAGVSAGAGILLEHSSVGRELGGFAGSRGVIFLLLFLPVNLWIVQRMAGIPARWLLGWAAPPVAAGAATVLLVWAVDRGGLLDHLGNVGALLVAGVLAVAALVTILFALDRRLRDEVLGRARRLRLRPTPSSRATG
jgi:O-antigen/teichoic acid export membrane protein